MALPKLETPSYFLELPSTGKQIKYRPFLVREEKLLLIAIETGDEKQITNTLKDIISSCTFNEHEVEKMPIFDLEYIFLQLRGKSRGEILDLEFKCQNIVGDEGGNTRICNTTNPTQLSVSDIKVIKDPTHTSTIKLSDNIGIKMQYPNMSLLTSFDRAKINNDVKSMFDIMTNCIESIFEGDVVHNVKDESPDAIIDFVDSLSQEQFEKIKEFFNTMPKMKHEISYDCLMCGSHEKVLVEGLQNFLD